MPSRKKLKVPFIKYAGIPSPSDIAPYLNSFEPTILEFNPWPDFKNSVKAKCTIAHNGIALFLKYFILENHLQAKAFTNGAISKDSCVEFFIDLDGDGKYYNLEFNSLGWAKIGYGSNRTKRELLNSNLVELVSSKSQINSTVDNGVKVFNWEIVLVIPLSLFCFSNINNLRGLKAQGNFYKCGDGLPEPHFLTWNLIETAEPDFHRPEYFGELEFSL